MSTNRKLQAPFEFCPFQYGEVKIREAAYILGTPYFTRRAIGEWLGYNDPQKAIDNIIERNPHIQNPKWAVPLKLRGTDGKIYATTIYHPIALQLIVFESRQPRAIEYKIATAKLVFDIMTGEYNRRLAKAFLGATGKNNQTQIKEVIHERVSRVKN